MKQNINLYQNASGGAALDLNARTVLIAWALTAGIVIAAQFWLGQRHNKIKQQLQAAQTAVQSSEEQLNVLTASMMAGTDPALETQLQEALRELDLRETILGLVSGTSAGDVDGFSGPMRSLARQQADGVWLTRIRISAPGARTTLDGRALSPEAVPIYLRQLSAEAALAGQGFDVFEIRRPEQAGEAIEFSLNRSDDRAPVRLVKGTGN